MLNSLYIGLSGMNAYSKGLNTISNNVANLNTAGFKASDVPFAEVYHSGQSGLSYLGSSQQGGGVDVGAPQLNFSQGELRASSSDLDLAIDGAGFLVLSKGDERLYTRTGQFSVNKDGFIVLNNGDEKLNVFDAKGVPIPADISKLRINPPVATSKITFGEILSSTATTANVADISVFTANGDKHTWTVNFTPVGAGSPGQWTVKITNETGAEVATTTLKFINGVVDPTTATLNITDSTTPSSPQSVVLDFSNVTSFSTGTTSTIKASSVDGAGVGSLSKVSVEANGDVKLTYSNSNTAILGNIAIADFSDPQALLAEGGGLYKLKGSSDVRFGHSGDAGIGAIKSKEIEASNVDLSQQFGELILIQRGYQASSQVVSVTNEMIQQLFGMRGNG